MPSELIWWPSDALRVIAIGWRCVSVRVSVGLAAGECDGYRYDMWYAGRIRSDAIDRWMTWRVHRIVRGLHARAHARAQAWPTTPPLRLNCPYCWRTSFRAPCWWRWAHTKWGALSFFQSISSFFPPSSCSADFVSAILHALFSISVLPCFVSPASCIVHRASCIVHVRACVRTCGAAPTSVRPSRSPLPFGTNKPPVSGCVGRRRLFLCACWVRRPASPVSVCVLGAQAGVRPRTVLSLFRPLKRCSASFPPSLRSFRVLPPLARSRSRAPPVRSCADLIAC